MPSPSTIDAELLSTLERAFAHHAGGDAAIDVADLQKALGLRSEYLARRVLAAFDRNGDGRISRDEFLSAVRALIFGTNREKLEFAFRLHDHDGDGALDAQELNRMIAIGLAEADADERVSQPPSLLAQQLLLAADKNRDGRVSLDELEAVMNERPQLLAQMTHSEAIWIAPNEELLQLLDETAGKRGRLQGERVAHVVVVVLFVLANLAVLGWSLRFGRAHLTTNVPMKIGRALGACLDLDGGLVLLPMMRRLVTWLRATWLGRVVPVDEAIEFHKLVGHSLFALAVAHAASFVLAFGSGHASFRVFATNRGLTGAVLLGVFAVMWLFALGFIRRTKRFELFYFTHLLYWAWLALSIAHAPRFAMFAGVPILGFVVEQIVRRGKRRPKTKMVRTYALRSGVTRLELEKPPGFRFGAGDYVFLRIPAIAKHEWHPFTISSAPEAPTLTFHVRSLGNWTAALRRWVEEKHPGELTCDVDGPYGSPSAHIFRSKRAVLIGAGIGVTPFASVLESIVLREGSTSSSLEKVHFIWLNRDQYSFEWFRGLLSRLEERDTRGLLDIHLCMTGTRTGIGSLGLELARDLMHEGGRSDLFTGLRTKTHLGPPNWPTLLGAIAAEHAPAVVDVFFCGPHGLARKLEPLCRRLGMRFREERF